MKRLLILTALLFATPCFAQSGGAIGPFSPCTAFGTTSGTCIQGAGAGGTPSSMTGTNITGTAAGLTAGNVTTNANLTGPIASVGNATSITAKVGTGTIFAMSAAPALTGIPTINNGQGTTSGITDALRLTNVGSNAGDGPAIAFYWDTFASLGAKIALSPTGAAAGDLLFQTGNGGAPTTKFSVSHDGLIANPTIPADTALTDSSVCQDTTNHRFYSGTGVGGLCLGTSSRRFKTGIVPLTVGLREILALKPDSFYLDKAHGDPKKQMYGFIAEDMVSALPKLVGRDVKGRIATADYLGVVPVLVKAVQEQNVVIAALSAKVSKLERASARGK